MKLKTVVADVRAFGASAPLRAAYETSKRVGLHALVFDRLISARGQTPRLVPILRPLARVPVESAERTLREARRIIGGTVVIFGREIEVGERPNWHALVHHDGEWPSDPWWKIDIRSSARIGDVKWAWELGRHRHLVVLARAAYLVPEEDAFVATLDAHCRSWVEQNPPERGVHWYSNLEIALRAINWLQVLSLAGDRLDAGLRRSMVSHLYHAGRHIEADLPYTVSTMRNNHLLGDGLGLVALGSAFAGDPSATRWRRLGDRLMTRQLARHMHADGSMIEDSLSYHRFVLEMLAVRAVIGEAPQAVTMAMVSGAKFLSRLGVSAGLVPQYGDWDEGRCLVSSAEALDVLGTVRLAAALGGDGGSAASRSEHDEVAWYAGEGTPLDLDDPEPDGAPVGGGIARMSRGDFTVWLKAGSAPSHGHADLSNVSMRTGAAWVVGDPGTGMYNGRDQTRDYFRTSIAHAVLRVDEQDQLVPHRAFRWRHSARGAVGVPLRVGSVMLMWGVHNAYRRVAERPRVVRAVLVGDGSVTVADWVEGSPRRYRLSLPLHPTVTWSEPDLRLADGRLLRAHLPGAVVETRGSDDPFDGWWSETYGSMVPATRLECRGTTDAPVAWSIGEVGTRGPDLDGQTIIADACRVGVTFTPVGVEVEVVAGTQAERSRLEFVR
jgi:Heparinase II/III-like protein/Heparinase II/III N-terminus